MTDLDRPFLDIRRMGGDIDRFLAAREIGVRPYCVEGATVEVVSNSIGAAISQIREGYTSGLVRAKKGSSNAWAFGPRKGKQQIEKIESAPGEVGGFRIAGQLVARDLGELLGCQKVNGHFTALFQSPGAARVAVWKGGEQVLINELRLPDGAHVADAFLRTEHQLCMLLEHAGGQKSLALVVPADVEELQAPAAGRNYCRLFGGLAVALVVLGALTAGVGLYRGDIELDPRILSALKNLKARAIEVKGSAGPKLEAARQYLGRQAAAMPARIQAAPQYIRTQAKALKQGLDAQVDGLIDLFKQQQYRAQKPIAA